MGTLLVYILLITLMAALTSPIYAADPTPRITVGTQEIGLTVGYMLPSHFKRNQTTNQQGEAFMPSWMMTVTDPLGDSWYRGQISLGAEMVYLQYQEPIVAHGFGFTPKIKYSFTALGRIRPYAEFAGGPLWTDLAGRIPEESSRFNFILSGGLGVSYFLTDQAALNVGYRYQHISNAHTSQPNIGLNASMPFVGFSFYF